MKKGNSKELPLPVPKTGFEPAHPFGRYHLKVVRLPISPPGHPLRDANLGNCKELGIRNWGFGIGNQEGA
jgi:hypothetical protein